MDETLFGPDPTLRPLTKGHAATPTTGPKNQTCGTCQHYTKVMYHNKNYRKCDLMTQYWTHGPGTDIRKKDPACEKWKEKCNITK